MRFLRDSSLSTITAGFVAMLVGYTSGIAAVFSAARALGADDDMLTSWVWALSVSMALITIVLSLRWRMPVMVAWSTPGAAVLATTAAGNDFTMAQAIGTFVVCGLVIAIVGFSGLFERIMNKIPMALASALLAGVLSRFAIDGFKSAGTEPLLVIGMFVAYLVGRRIAPLYTMPITLLAGTLLAVLSGDLQTDGIRVAVTRPILTSPEFSLSAIISLGIPLLIVTMAGQNLPGVAAIRTFGYPVPISRTLGSAGAGTVLFAPAGAFMLNLSAFTAAIVMGPEAHADRDRRYTGAVWNGIFYLVVGLFATVVTGLLTAFPIELIKAVAALALLTTIINNLHTALATETMREPAIVTFLVTLSGVTLLRVGSAFWGAIAGLLALAVIRFRKPASAS